MRTLFQWVWICLVCYPAVSCAQTFQNAYKNTIFSGDLKFSSIARRPDGALLSSVYNRFYPQYNYSAGIACFQADGSPLWILGDAQKKVFLDKSVYPLPDNSAVVSGVVSTNNNGQFSEKSIIARVDADGNVLWSRMMSQSGAYLFNGNLACGQTTLYATGNNWQEVFLAGLRPDGAVLWEKRIQADSMQCSAVQTTPDGHLLAALTFQDYTRDLSYLLEINENGQLIRSRLLHCGLIYDIKVLSGGEILLSSRRLGASGNQNVPVVALLDAQWTPLWAQVLEIQGWDISFMIAVPNLAENVFSLFASSQNSEEGIAEIRFNPANPQQEGFCRPGIELGSAIRLPDGSLAIAGARVHSLGVEGMLLHADETFDVQGCPKYPMCQFVLEPFDLRTDPLNLELQPTSQMQPFTLNLVKSTLQQAPWCPAPPAPYATLLPIDTVFCVGEKAEFFAENPGKSFWRFSNAEPAEIWAYGYATTTFTRPGIASVTRYTYLNSCFFDSIRQEITVLPGPDLQLPPVGPLCAGDSILLAPQQAAADWEFQWQDGLPVPERSATASGVYILQATDAAGCTAADTVVLEFRERPLVDLLGPTRACSGETLTLTAQSSAAALLQWNTGSTAPEISVQTSGWYAVMASNGPCRAVDSLRVTFENCPDCTLFLPNIFAPESAGANARWQVQCNCLLWNCWIQIYNRWGELVFESRDADQAWDGYYKGDMLPAGVYTCRLRVSGDNGNERKDFSQITDITLIR